MGRSPCCNKVGLNRGPWSSTEDRALTAYIEAHGEGQWRNLAKRAGLKRCGKSCRLRWLNYLRPDIKRGNISHDEEDLIIRLHKLLGNRWSLIAGRLPGRTDNEIKNYWNTTLGKKIEADQYQRYHHHSSSPPKSTSKLCRSRSTTSKSKCKSKRPFHGHDEEKNISPPPPQPAAAVVRPKALKWPTSTVLLGPPTSSNYNSSSTPPNSVIKFHAPQNQDDQHQVECCDHATTDQAFKAITCTSTDNNEEREGRGGGGGGEGGFNYPLPFLDGVNDDCDQMVYLEEDWTTSEFLQDINIGNTSSTSSCCIDDLGISLESLLDGCDEWP